MMQFNIKHFEDNYYNLDTSLSFNFYVLFL